MKTKLIRFTTVLLALLCICSMISLVSCNNNSTMENKTGEVSTKEQEGTEIDTSKVDYISMLPDKKFDFETVNIAVMSTRVSYFDAENATTNVEKEIVNRNEEIEGKYDVFIEYTSLESSQSKFSGVCSQMLMAGVSDYDLIAPDYYYGLETSGAFLNLNDLKDQIHFDRPYWVSGWNNNVTVNGKLFAAVGYYTLDVIAQVECCFFNGYRADQYTYEEECMTDAIYQKVEAGTWTMETMLAMGKLFTVHNDSSKYSFEDNYGISYNIWSGRSFLNAGGFQFSTRTENGDISFANLSGESNYNIFQKVYRILNDKANCYYGGGGGESDGDKGDLKLFTSGRSLFNLSELGRAARYSTELDSVNVVPMPKYDAAQENYISTLLGTCIFAIFKTAKNPELSATILEAMNVYSYVYVRPTYYELLKLRYQTDERSSNAVDMLMESINLDFLFCNAGSFVVNVEGTDYSVPDTPFNLIVTERGDIFKSTMKKFVDQLNEKMVEYLKVYEDEK